jgi:hypothetical protein
LHGTPERAGVGILIRQAPSRVWGGALRVGKIISDNNAPIFAGAHFPGWDVTDRKGSALKKEANLTAAAGAAANLNCVPRRDHYRLSSDCRSQGLTSKKES